MTSTPPTSAADGSSNQNLAPSTFPQFGRMPPELRRMVWKYAMAEPRIVRVSPVSPYSNRKIRHRLIIRGKEYEQVPKFFFVNAESRQVADEHYQSRFSLCRNLSLATYPDIYPVKDRHFIFNPNDILFDDTDVGITRRQWKDDQFYWSGDMQAVRKVMIHGSTVIRSFQGLRTPPLPRPAGEICSVFYLAANFVNHIPNRKTEKLYYLPLDDYSQSHAVEDDDLNTADRLVGLQEVVGDKALEDRRSMLRLQRSQDQCVKGVPNLEVILPKRTWSLSPRADW